MQNLRRQRESTIRAAEGADQAVPALKIQVSAPSTFAPCEKAASRLLLTPFPAAPRAPAALPAASGQSPRALGVNWS
jgi:hypothetical protein